MSRWKLFGGDDAEDSSSVDEKYDDLNDEPYNIGDPYSSEDSTEELVEEETESINGIYDEFEQLVQRNPHHTEDAYDRLGSVLESKGFHLDSDWEMYPERLQQFDDAVELVGMDGGTNPDTLEILRLEAEQLQDRRTIGEAVNAFEDDGNHVAAEVLMGTLYDDEKWVPRLLRLLPITMESTAEDLGALWGFASSDDGVRALNEESSESDDLYEAVFLVLVHPLLSEELESDIRDNLVGDESVLPKGSVAPEAILEHETRKKILLDRGWGNYIPPGR